jgi:hypothetical protein
MFSPTILAILIAVFADLSFTGGFVINDWRSGAQNAHLKSDNAVLTAANGKWATDIESVRQSVSEIKRGAG